MTTQWSRALTDYRAWMIAGGKPRSSARLRTIQLANFAGHHADPWSVTTLDMVQWMADQQWATETRRSYRSALRGFYRWAVIAGHLSTSPADALPIIRPGAHRPRPAPELVVVAGLEAHDERVRVMVRLAAQHGLRRGEIAQVNVLEDLGEDLGGPTLLVHGKGDKERWVPIDGDLVAAMRRLACPAGWVFPGRTSGHLSPDRVGVLIAQALPGHWTAHPLRHRFATRAYAGSRDLAAVQALLGHTKPETTMRYVELPGDAMRAAARWAA